MVLQKYIFASLKTFQHYPRTSDMRVSAACSFGANNGTRKGDAPIPLLQYKPSYSFPFTILLSMAICRKKSIFA
jgi:hypothetical protein